MSLERSTRSNERETAEVLAELTGRPIEEFEYDGPIPDAEKQEWERLEEE